VESNSLDGTARLLKPGAAPEALDISTIAPSSLDMMIDSLLDGTPMPISLTDELSPTRSVVRASLSL
jgi:hypothetical protein